MIENNKNQITLEEIMNALEAQLIMLMRNYDATMSLLAAQSPYAAEQLAAVHEQGKTITDLPFYTTEEEQPKV